MFSSHPDSAPEGEGSQLPEIVPVFPPPAPDDSVAEAVRRTVAQVKGIPLDDVGNDTVLGQEFQVIAMNIVFNLGNPVFASINMTVGELIAQASKMHKDHKGSE